MVQALTKLVTFDEFIAWYPENSETTAGRTRTTAGRTRTAAGRTGTTAGRSTCGIFKKSGYRSRCNLKRWDDRS